MITSRRLARVGYVMTEMNQLATKQTNVILGGDADLLRNVQSLKFS